MSISLHLKPIVLTILSTKGGGHKTTNTVNMASWLAKYNDLKVLVIDADPMQSFSLYNSDYVPATHGLTNVIRTGSFDDAITKSSFEGIDFVYNDDPKNDLSNFLRERADGAFVMSNVIKQVPAQYDVVVIDTAPHNSKILETSIVAANLLITPILLEPLSARELERGTLAIVDELRGQLSDFMLTPFPSHVGFLAEVKRTNISAQTRAALLEAMKDKKNFKMFDFVIRNRTAIVEAAGAEIPIFEHKSSATAEIKEWYDQLMPMLLSQMGAQYE